MTDGCPTEAQLLKNEKKINQKYETKYWTREGSKKIITSTITSRESQLKLHSIQNGVKTCGENRAITRTGKNKATIHWNLFK